VQPTSEERRALFEPFEKTQAKLREFARRQSWRTVQKPKELAPAEAGGLATANMVLDPFSEKKDLTCHG